MATAEQLAKNFSTGAFQQAKERLMQRVGLVALARSQPLTPVRTGTLRRSETSRSDAQNAWIGSNVEYAPFVHARVPFFAEGIQDSAGDIERLLQQFGDEVVAGWAS